jgi:hypothetical protein
MTLISGFRRDVDVICGLLGNYKASCGNYLPTFRDNVSVSSSWVKIARWKESLWQGNLAARRGREPCDVTMANRMRGWGGGFGCKVTTDSTPLLIMEQILHEKLKVSHFVKNPRIFVWGSHRQYQEHRLQHQDPTRSQIRLLQDLF